MLLSLSENFVMVLEILGNRLSKIMNPVNKSLAVISAILVFVMAILIALDIMLRIFFHAPIAGTLELESYLLVTVVFLTLGYAMIEKQHVSIDLISSHYSRKTSLLLNSIFSLLSLYLFVIIGWQNFIRAMLAIEDHEISMVLEFPLAPFFFIAFFGCLLLTLVLATNILKYQVEIIKKTRRS